ncbi:MAG: hypothetical protein K2O33_08745, partial [Muribaculaceae bacterium]|nr:hypothetical protein [Muribaculaceae bacterium]
MKNIFKWSGLAALAFGFALTACSDFEPTGLPEEVPSLAKVSDLTATVNGHNIDLSWKLPDAKGIEGLVLTHNAIASSAVDLPAGATSYTVVGQPIEEEHIYTVKVKYDGGYVSEGVSVTAVLPHEDLADVTSLTAAVEGRTVTLAWTLPAADGITGVTVTRGDNGQVTTLDADATGCVLEKQPVDSKVTYTVKVVYDTYY